MLIKQQFAITHLHTVFWDSKKLDQSSPDEHLTMLSFYEYIRTSNFFLWTQHSDRRCVCNPSSNSEISEELCGLQQISVNIMYNPRNIQVYTMGVATRAHKCIESCLYLTNSYTFWPTTWPSLGLFFNYGFL